MNGSTARTKDRPLQVLIVCYSRYGVVKLLAERIAEGAGREPGVEAELLVVDDMPVTELRSGEEPDDMRRRRAALVNRLADADALIVGSPSYFGGMASPVKRLFEDCTTAEGPDTQDRSRPWRHHLFRDKVGAAFTASGTPHGGNEQTLLSILTMLMHLGMIVVTPGQRPPILEHEAAPYGATAISGADGRRLPSDPEQDEARALGEQVARVALWVRQGREAWAQARYGRGAGGGRRRFSFDPSA
jgi:NAD(P)H dehydrogenase (quinone)